MVFHWNNVSLSRVCTRLLFILRILSFGKLLASPNHIWAGLNSVTELAKITDVPAAYVHPTSQQCTIPLATTEIAGLMSPSDKLKLQTMSYNWTDLGEANISRQEDYGNSSDTSARVSVNIASYCAQDLHACVLVRIEYNVDLDARASCSQTSRSATLSVSVRANGVILDEDSKTGQSINMSIQAKYNTIFTHFLVPTEARYSVYSDQSLSNKISDISIDEVNVSAQARITGSPNDRSVYASISGKVHFYAVL